MIDWEKEENKPENWLDFLEIRNLNSTHKKEIIMELFNTLYTWDKISIREQIKHKIEYE